MRNSMYSNPFKSAYGRTNYKAICTKDSVKENLESKDYTAEDKAVWLSSTKDSFQVYFIISLLVD